MVHMKSKSVSKRFRVTKNGKLLRRSMAVDHARTRKSTRNLRNKRKMRSMDYPINRLLH
jgi:ribosomal protein L35